MITVTVMTVVTMAAAGALVRFDGDRPPQPQRCEHAPDREPECSS